MYTASATNSKLLYITHIFGRKNGHLTYGPLCLSTPKHNGKSGTAVNTKYSLTTNIKICRLVDLRYCVKSQC